MKSPTGAWAPRSGRAYQLLVLAATILPLAAILGVDSDLSLGIRATAGLLWILALAPSLFYVSVPPATRAPIPLIQVIGCLYGLYFALPAMMGAVGLSPLVSLDPSDYHAAVELALLGWVLALIGYAIARSVVRPPMWTGTWNWNPRVVRHAGFTLGLLGVAFDFLRSEVVIGLTFAGSLHFLASLSFVGIGLLVALLARGELDRLGMAVLSAIVLLSAAAQVASGSAANLALLGFVVFAAAWAARRELPLRWLGAALVLVLLVIALRGIIGDFRAVAWVATQDMGIAERSGLAGKLLTEQVGELGLAGSLREGGEAVASRSAHLELFADVIRRTPTEVPYWGGETYVSLVGMPVPRFLWPEKPVKELGQEFGHRYGYLAPDDRRTSINLPFLIEFYANHGLLGLFLGMVLIGLVYGVLAGLLNHADQPLLLSVAALVLFLPLLNIESDFSLIFGGLMLQGIGLAGILWLIILRGSRAPASRPS